MLSSELHRDQAHIKAKYSYNKNKDNLFLKKERNKNQKKFTGQEVIGTTLISALGKGRQRLADLSSKSD